MLTKCYLKVIKYRRIYGQDNFEIVDTNFYFSGVALFIDLYVIKFINDLKE